MAKCCYCNKEISLFLFWKSRMWSKDNPYTLRRYVHEKIGAPFIYCPSCKQEIQPTVLTSLGSVLAIIIPMFLFVLLFPGNILFIIGGFVISFFLGVLWWKYQGKFKKPAKLPWEKKE